jgi:hypothetical protein
MPKKIRGVPERKGREQGPITLYGVLGAPTKDGLVRVGSLEAFEVDWDEDLYWPNRSGAGDENLYELRPDVTETLRVHEQKLLKLVAEAAQDLKDLQGDLARTQAGILDPSKVHVSKRERP